MMLYNSILVRETGHSVLALCTKEPLMSQKQKKQIPTDAPKGQDLKKNVSKYMVGLN